MNSEKEKEPFVTIKAENISYLMVKNSEGEEYKLPVYEGEPKIYMVRAYDHFSSDKDNIDYPEVEMIGKLLAEDDKYIFLQHIDADIYDKEAAIEYHGIFKASITRKIEFHAVSEEDLR